MKAIRHGDVLLVPVDRVEGDLTELSRDPRLGVVLAYGETTGHAHHLADPGARLFEPSTLCRFFHGDTELVVDAAGGGAPRLLTVEGDATLLHHDHGVGVPDGTTEMETPIAPGKYIVIRQRERSFSDIAGYRRVSD